MLDGPGHKQRAERLRRGFAKAHHGFPQRRLSRGFARALRDIGLVAMGCVFGVAGTTFMEKAPGFDSGSAQRFVYYASCREAFLDRAASIRRGEPGYRPELDADSDGIACEPYRGP